MKRVSIFLMTVALIAGMAGCAPAQYNLIISSTEGGSVTIPGEDTFTYNEGKVVALVAEADEGYRFVDWTGYVNAIADVTAAATNITMNDHYSVTANFALDICLEIRDWYDLDAIKDNLFGSYILMNDLDSTTPGYEELASPTANGGRGWWPIGPGMIGAGIFKGIFNGQGYEICDLFIYRPKESGAGLFCSVGEAGVIKDIGVVNVTVSGADLVGGLVGYNRGTVSNCYSSGNVTGIWSVGSLVGENYGIVSNSSSSGNVTGYGLVGGLVGLNSGTVNDSYSTGSVSGNERVGGLVGFNWLGDVFNSYSTGIVTSNYYVGGLVGDNKDATVSNSYSTGSVTGGEYVGGLVGHNVGEGGVSDSYSTGSVTGGEYVGGLVGWNHAGVSNSFCDTETAGMEVSDGGTGKTTAEMKSIATFSGAEWDICAVANPTMRSPACTWNIVDKQTYPFLSWQP